MVGFVAGTLYNNIIVLLLNLVVVFASHCLTYGLMLISLEQISATYALCLLNMLLIAYMLYNIIIIIVKETGRGREKERRVCV